MFRQTRVLLAGALSLFLSSVSGAGVATAEEESFCPKVEIIATSGTGQAREYDDPNEVYIFSRGTEMVETIAAKYEGVTAWQTPYPASLGLAGTFTPRRSSAMLPYGESKRMGVNTILDHLDQRSQQCPSTKYVLTGYSQGADVTGQVAQEIAAGVASVGPESILAVYQFADPQRAPLTGEEGEAVGGAPGMLTEDGGVVIPVDQGLPPAGSRGLSGSRKAGAFEPLAGKVVQICSPKDIACAAPAEGVLVNSGAWAVDVDPSPYTGDFAELNSMTCQGQLFRAMTPFLPPIAHGLRTKDGHIIERSFDAASRSPYLSPAEGASIRMLGREITGVLEGTGDLLSSNPQARINEFMGLSVFAEMHGSYFEDSAETTTIGGVRADDWVRAHMANRIAAELGLPEDNVADYRPAPQSAKPLIDIDGIMQFCAK